MRHLPRALLLLVVTLVGTVALTGAQSRGGSWGRPELPYDGGLTFVRLRWSAGTYGVPVLGGGYNFWLHEFPRAEQNLMAVVDDYTFANVRTDGSLILEIDDPALFRHPIVTMWEPGFWAMTDDQASVLRAYLLKGGFLVFNDFEGIQWDNFVAQTRRILPDVRWRRLEPSHPIFHSFFQIHDFETPNPLNHHLAGLRPEYFGLFEDDDPNGRLMSVAFYNTNLGEYWMLAGTGLLPWDALGRGFQLGVNYMMYGLTH